MHKQFKYVGLFLAFSLNNALATESVDVRVIGTIAPSACVIMLTGGGVVDYGAIKPETLSEDDFNVLAGKKLDLSINCAAPTMVALKSGLLSRLVKCLLQARRSFLSSPLLRQAIFLSLCRTRKEVKK